MAPRWTLAAALLVAVTTTATTSAFLFRPGAPQHWLEGGRRAASSASSARRRSSSTARASPSPSAPPAAPAQPPAAAASSSSSASGAAQGGAAREAAGAGGNGDTVYVPKGWDRPIYRAPDDILFEWQELLCCLRFMEEKEVNAAMLAPETKEMMIGYAEAIMARGSPINTLEGLAQAMMGKWKLAFTTEDRYKVLPPATRIIYNIRRDGTMDNIVKFKDKYWDSLVSTARYQLSPQGRLVFEFTSNHVNVNNPLSQGSQFKLPLPQNVGNLGTAFADVSYMDGTMWIEKLRDQASGQIYYTIYEYLGPCEGENGKEPQAPTTP